MLELIFWFIVIALFFITIVLSVLIGILKKRRKLFIISGISFVLLIASFVMFTYTLIGKSYKRISTMNKPKVDFKDVFKAVKNIPSIFHKPTGEDMYEDIFGKPKSNCVKVVNWMDAVIPIMDADYILEFKTCPEEVRRIIQLKKYDFVKMTSRACTKMGADWFKPETLGDSVLMYNWSDSTNRTHVDLSISTDSTHAFYLCWW